MSSLELELDGLRRSYGTVTALDGLTFSVEAGTVFALLGPNGAGKSTAVKILTTLTQPDAGEATVPKPRSVPEQVARGRERLTGRVGRV